TPVLRADKPPLVPLYCTSRQRPLIGEARMTHADAFLEAIAEEPHKDDLRLIYADWLEDNGDPDRAEFIRVQIRLAKMDEDDEERPELERRERELLAAHQERWEGMLESHCRGWTWWRGFLDDVQVSPRQFLKHARRIMRLGPCTRLSLTYSSPEDVAKLAASPFLKRVRVLTLANRIGSTAGDLRLLFSSPHLARLEGLWLLRTGRFAELFDILLESSFIRRLQSLDVSGNQPGVSGLE